MVPGRSVHVELPDGVVCATVVGSAVYNDLNRGSKVKKIHGVDLWDGDGGARACELDRGIYVEG